MFIVSIENNGIKTEILNTKEKLISGKVVKGINTIDTFSFALLPSNIGFNKINDRMTLVKVYNTNKKRYEFHGRALYSDTTMQESGLITKEVICESYFGFLCDSKQHYVDVQNWTVEGLLQHIINEHNSQVEEYKRFTLGEVTVTDPNDNLYLGIQRENTWETIKKKLIDVLGGEIQFRVDGEIIYLDYLTEIGTTRATKISVSRNMKSIKQEKDPSAYVTRLIPLGHKLEKEITSTDEEGNEVIQTVETEERLDISSVNDGKDYLDDLEAIEKYGIRVDTQEWDDVTDPANLKAKGEAWMAANNKVQIKYSITALDLSLIKLDLDDFEVHDYYPIENPLIGVKDTARITKKTLDVIEEMKSTIEVGENFKTLSDMQVEQAAAVADAANAVKKIEGSYATNQDIVNETEMISSMIQQNAESIMLSVTELYQLKSAAAEVEASVQAQLAVLADEIAMNFTSNSEHITSVDGDVQSKFTELYKYIRFNENGITIGSSESGIVLNVDNDMITFSKDGVVFGRWDGNDFYTGNIVVRVDERAQFGNFAFVPRSDGSLSFLKI